MNYAQAICDALDQLDTTPFGQMGEALDKISDIALKATLERQKLVVALENVRALIAEAAMTGFNHKDGDWAERLFSSQQDTSAALYASKKA
jgi:hypothetical protein